MKSWIAAIFVGFLFTLALLSRPVCGARDIPAPQTQPTTQAIRFQHLDIFLDSGVASLAAYQFELKAIQGDVKIVGVEGGEAPAFREAPFYDPHALSQNRIIIAAFSTSDSLPAGAIRVARVHLYITGPTKPVYQIRLMAAGDREGIAIRAIASIREGDNP